MGVGRGARYAMGTLGAGRGSFRSHRLSFAKVDGEGQELRRALLCPLDLELTSLLGLAGAP